MFGHLSSNALVESDGEEFQRVGGDDPTGREVEVFLFGLERDFGDASLADEDAGESLSRVNVEGDVEAGAAHLRIDEQNAVPRPRERGGQIHGDERLAFTGARAGDDDRLEVGLAVVQEQLSADRADGLGDPGRGIERFSRLWNVIECPPRNPRNHANDWEIQESFRLVP